MADNGCTLIDSLERQWRDALCAKDMARLRELIHPSFVLIGMRSSAPFRMVREEWLAAIEKRELVSINLNVIDAFVTAHLMVGTIEARWRVRYLGQEIEDCVMLTDVWVCEGDRWQVVRRHSSPMAPGTCGAR